MSTRLYCRLVVLAVFAILAVARSPTWAGESAYVLKVKTDWQKLGPPALEKLRTCLADRALAPRADQWEAICDGVIREAMRAILQNDADRYRRNISEEENEKLDRYLNAQANAWEEIKTKGESIIRERDEIVVMSARILDQTIAVREKKKDYWADAVALMLTYNHWRIGMDLWEREKRLGIHGAKTDDLKTIYKEMSKCRDEYFGPRLQALTYAVAKEAAEIAKFNLQYTPERLRDKVNGVRSIAIFTSGKIRDPDVLKAYQDVETKWDADLNNMFTVYQGVYARYEQDARVLAREDFLDAFEFATEPELERISPSSKAQTINGVITEILTEIDKETDRRGVPRVH